MIFALLAAACNESPNASTGADATTSSGTHTDVGTGSGGAGSGGANAGGGGSGGTGAEAPFLSTTFDNFDDASNPITRFDVNGDAIDAHDGGIYLFEGVYYLYGTSYDCGYLYRSNSKFCGFKVYSSPDLAAWTDRGFVVPAQTCQYCFRPHVIYDAVKKRYVLWVNSGGALGGGPYTVFVNDSPTGPFTMVGSPQLNRPNGIDFNVFVDEDAARTGYLIHNDTASPLNHGGRADLVVERLNADYTAPLLGAEHYVELGLTDVESMSAFVRKGLYYLTMSDPTCAYCNTNTGYLTASAMLGPWNGIWTLTPPGLDQNDAPETAPDQRSILISGVPERRSDSDSCQTQATHVVPLPLRDGSTTYLFMGDQWDHRQQNESLAGYFWAPLEFDANGAIRPLACPKTVTLSLAEGSRGSAEVPPDLAVTSGTSGFRPYCDIGAQGGAVWRAQIFSATRTGVLTKVSLTTFQRGSADAQGDAPNAPLIIDVVDATNGPTGPALATETIPATSVGWSPHNAIVSPNIPVTAGHLYAIRAHSSTTAGCYGWNYNDANGYAAGIELYSTDNGATFHAEERRDLKFWVAIR